MADAVPDPDDGMMDNIENENNDRRVEEPQEPCDDLNAEFLDTANSNHDDFNATAEMEPAPVAPQPTAFKAAMLKADLKKFYGNTVVHTEAVDLEAICNSYHGCVLNERLQFIVDRCTVLRRDATIALVKMLKEKSMDVGRYNSLMSSLEQLDSDVNCTRHLELPKHDSAWVDSTVAKAANLLELYQAEYKKMKDEGVKESTRRAMEELFEHYVNMGNYTDALRLYGRGMREYCTQFKQLMKMWIEWLIISVCAGEWTKIDPLISQAQRSINEAEEAEEKAQVAATSSRQHPQQHPPIDAHSRANRALITASQMKIDALSGVCRMKCGTYVQALEKFTKVDVDIMGTEWLFSSSDLAIYTTLCALVAYDRAELKKKVLTDSLCRKFLEAEPRLIELLNSFIRSDFGRCLDILAERKDSFYLNPFLASHVDNIYGRIRQRAIIQYIRPFATAKLGVMANVFRVSPVEMEEEVVKLITKDLINAKIDAIEGVVRTTQIDKRAETFQKVNELCDRLIDSVDGIISKAIVIQARVCTGVERNNKRKEPDEGFDTVGGVSRSRMGILKNIMGGKGYGPSSSAS